MLHVYMCWIDYYGVLYSVFWMAPLWVHTHNYSALNGFNSEVVHEHSATHHYLLSIPFHFSQPFDKHYFYWQVISQLIWLRLVYLFKENWTGLPVNGHRFNRKHCTSAWSRLKFHINIRVFVCVCVFEVKVDEFTENIKCWFKLAIHFISSNGPIITGWNSIWTKHSWAMSVVKTLNELRLKLTALNRINTISKRFTPQLHIKPE